VTLEPGRSTLAPAVRVLTRWTLDGVVLLHLDGGDPMVLTGPGATLWSVLEAGPTRPDDLVATMATEYGVEPAFVARELAGVIGHLERSGMIVPGEQGRP
jgi:hypothetical protein